MKMTHPLTKTTHPLMVTTHFLMKRTMCTLGWTLQKNDVLDFVNDSMKKIEKYVHKRFNQTYNEIMGDLEHDEVLEQEGGCSHRVNCKSEMQV